MARASGGRGRGRGRTVGGRSGGRAAHGRGSTGAAPPAAPTVLPQPLLDARQPTSGGRGGGRRGRPRIASGDAAVRPAHAAADDEGGEVNLFLPPRAPRTRPRTAEEKRAREEMLEELETDDEQWVGARAERRVRRRMHELGMSRVDAAQASDEDDDDRGDGPPATEAATGETCAAVGVAGGIAVDHFGAAAVAVDPAAVPMPPSSVPAAGGAPPAPPQRQGDAGPPTRSRRPTEPLRVWRVGGGGAAPRVRVRVGSRESSQSRSPRRSRSRGRSPPRGTAPGFRGQAGSGSAERRGVDRDDGAGAAAGGQTPRPTEYTHPVDAKVLSVTITSTGGRHLPKEVFYRLFFDADAVCRRRKCVLRFAAAYELGGTLGHGHIQAVLVVAADFVRANARDGREGTAVLKDWWDRAKGWRGVGPRPSDSIIVKTKLVHGREGYTFHYMIGYCIKSRNDPAASAVYEEAFKRISEVPCFFTYHFPFLLRVLGVEASPRLTAFVQEDIRQGQLEHLLHGAEKKIKSMAQITRANIFFLAHHFRAQEMQHTGDLVSVLLALIRSAHFTPHPSWVVPDRGLMDFERSMLCFRVHCDPASTTEDDIKSIFFQDSDALRTHVPDRTARQPNLGRTQREIAAERLANRYAAFRDQQRPVEAARAAASGGAAAPWMPAAMGATHDSSLDGPGAVGSPPQDGHGRGAAINETAAGAHDVSGAVSRE